MNNITIENKGTITLGEKVMVSDPCYGLGTWCQGVLENVLPGVYDCNVEYSDEGDWGVRVSAIEVTHESCRGKFIALNLEDFEVGVDSGQAGIFDYEYYAKYHMDATERPHVDDDWYDMVCDLTLTYIPNPDYEEFHWESTDDSIDPIDNLLAKWDAHEEYMESIKSRKYLSKSDGNITDGLGLVSSSGYGDGGYNCWTARNEDGKIVAIRVEFITEDDYEDEDYEEE
jgi:hypothetical protein